MTEYSFTLRLAPLDKLRAAWALPAIAQMYNALVGGSLAEPWIAMDVEAPTLELAIESARARLTNLGLTVTGLEPCEKIIAPKAGEAYPRAEPEQVTADIVFGLSKDPEDVDIQIQIGRRLKK